MGCHTVYDTTYEKVCKTISKSVCTLVPTTQYRTEVDNVCTNVPEKVCVPTQQTVPGEPACTTHTEQACSVEVQTVVDTVVQQECQDIQHQVCQETRVAQQVQLVGVQQHAELIGHQVAAPAVVGAVAGPAVVGAAPAVVGAAPAVVGAAAPALDARFLAAQAQFGLPAGALPAPGAFAVPAAGHVIAKRAPESEPESEADAEARDGKSLLLSRLGAAPVAPAAVAVGPPACRVEVERRCRDVPVSVPRAVEVPKCVPVPKPIASQPPRLFQDHQLVTMSQDKSATQSQDKFHSKYLLKNVNQSQKHSARMYHTSLPDKYARLPTMDPTDMDTNMDMDTVTESIINQS